MGLSLTSTRGSLLCPSAGDSVSAMRTIATPLPTLRSTSIRMASPGSKEIRQADPVCEEVLRGLRPGRRVHQGGVQAYVDAGEERYGGCGPPGDQEPVAIGLLLFQDFHFHYWTRFPWTHLKEFHFHYALPRLP